MESSHLRYEKLIASLYGNVTPSFWHLMLTVSRQTIISRKLLLFAIKIMGEKKREDMFQGTTTLVISKDNSE
jgi:hypothetical protein